uniref:Putative ovule protein n=1 Tax=Solanum chacoense TaxID=4108 RepID=A0A0V0GII6_SOLCH
MIKTKPQRISICITFLTCINLFWEFYRLSDRWVPKVEMIQVIQLVGSSKAHNPITTAHNSYDTVTALR